MRILLAEPQALTREGLKRLVLAVYPASEFVEAADTAAARAALAGAASLDAALFDDALFDPGELLALRHGRPRLLLIALTARGGAAADAEWLAAGVNALVPKSAPTAVFRAVLQLAVAGDVCVQSTSVAHSPQACADATLKARRGTGTLNLTPRQHDVLALVARGCANKAIADELGIGVRTVKGHVSVILRALHADNRADAGRNARRWLAREARR